MMHRAKRWFIAAVFLAVLFCFTACTKAGTTETSQSETTAGGSEDVVLDGSSTFEPLGTPITDDEIIPLIQQEMESGTIPADGYVSGCGYYYIKLTSNSLDYDYYTLPIIKDDKIWGEISFQRQADGSVQTARVAEFGQDDELSRILQENPGKSFALVFSQYSQYAIMEDNTVYTVYGSESEIKNQDRLFEAFNLEDNLISDRIFDDAQVICESEENLPTESASVLETEEETEPLVIEYTIESSENDRYYLWVEEFVKCDDSFIIRGKKSYYGTIALTWEQKALLDAGAVLSIVYDGVEMTRVYAMIDDQYNYNTKTREHLVVYRTADRHMPKFNLMTADACRTSYAIDISGAPYYGFAFVLKTGDTTLPYNLVLDSEFELIIPGDIAFDSIPYGTDESDKQWTLNEFYEQVMCPEGYRIYELSVYLQEGEAVRVVDNVIP